MKFLLITCALLSSALMSGGTITITDPSTFETAYADAAEGSTIVFDASITEVILSNNYLTMKTITVDGTLPDNKRVTFKHAIARSFFHSSGTTTASLTLKNIIFEGNSPTATNSGINAVAGTTLNIENCDFKNIIAGANNGGAIRVQGNATIKNCLFENNESTTGGYGGGAICIYNAANVTIENSSFIANKAIRGGAIMVNGTFSGASAADADKEINLSVTNCTFANNEATLTGTNQRGGAIYFQTATFDNIYADIINCTIVGNRAGNNGGGICFFPSSGKKVNINFINSILLYNKTGNNSDIDFFSYYSDRINFQGVNCIYGTNVKSGAGTLPAWGNSTAFDYDLPEDVFEATESDNFTRPVISLENGLKVAKLSSSSIAIGAGLSSFAGFTIPTKDQLGNSRSTPPAIGAVEYVSQQGNSVCDLLNSNEIKIKHIANQVYFEGLNEISEVQVYSLTGALIRSAWVSDQQSLSLEGLQQGIGIIRVKNNTFKVLFK